VLIRIITAATAGLAGIAATALVVVVQQPDAVRLDQSAASAATFATEPEPDAVTDESDEADCRPLGSRLPEDLREDLEALRDLDPDERADELDAIRQRALDGEYGDRAQERADQLSGQFDGRFEGRFGGRFDGALRDRVEARLDGLPEALREDLLAVRELPVEDRRGAVEKIHEDALAGSYGDEVQDRAETLGERVEDLRERFGDRRGDQGSRFGGRLGAHVPGASLGICLD
jgi:hypothetical protein